MEHQKINSIADLYRGTEGKESLKEKLLTFAEEIHSKNQRFNLTGHKTKEDIIEKLIHDSIYPLRNLNVPRGTSLCDLGTGSGIPGIPLALFNENLRATLFDSNAKKIRFVNSTARTLGLKESKGECVRLEEIGHNPQYRESFDIATSRAMAEVPVVCELAAPLVKENGFIILYTNDRETSMSEKILRGLAIRKANEEERRTLLQGDEAGILLLKKTGPTKKTFPRRIKRIRSAAKYYVSET